MAAAPPPPQKKMKRTQKKDNNMSTRMNDFPVSGSRRETQMYVLLFIHNFDDNSDGPTKKNKRRVADGQGRLQWTLTGTLNW